MPNIEVLLIHPPIGNFDNKKHLQVNQANLQVEPPLGICYIAAVLEKHNFSVRILDMDALRVPFSAIPKYLQLLNPQIVGITANTVLFPFSVKIAQKAKAWNPDINVVFGGIHPTIRPEEVLQTGVVDVAVRGEGEYTMLELAEYWLKHKGSLHNILGINYIEHKLFKSTPDRPLEMNLDNFPFPAKHLLLGRAEEVYFSALAKTSPTTSMIISRGCPFRCTFCTRIFFTSRLRSKENVLEEIRYNIESAKYPARHIDFMDSQFNMSPKFSAELCKSIIREKFDFQWRGIFRPELINEKLVLLMKAAGCFITTIGAESGSDRILRFLKKGYLTEDILKAFKLTRLADIETHTIFMMGIPGETSNDLKLTRNLINKIQPNYLQIQIFVPGPGTEIWDLLLAKNILRDTSMLKKQIGAKSPVMNWEEMPNIIGGVYPTLNLVNLPNDALKRYRNSTVLMYYLSLPFFRNLGKTVIRNPWRFPTVLKKLLYYHFSST